MISKLLQTSPRRTRLFTRTRRISWEPSSYSSNVRPHWSETTDTGLQIALPGSKFQYYRPVFKDFEDILQRLKTRLLSFTDAPNEVRQMALNQLDDHIPPPPPESPPPSPSSPEYSPVYWSPSTDDNDESHDDNEDASDSYNTDDESTIIE